MATTHPCVCTCTCAWPRAASGTCNQQLGKPRPTGIRWGRGHRAVSTQRTTPSDMVGNSGKIRAVVVWKEECFRVGPSGAPTARGVGRAGPTWGRTSCPVNIPGRGGGAMFSSSPQNHGLSFSLPCPPNSTTNPGSYSYSQPSSRAVGSWAGLVGRAGLTIAARDSRRAFGAVGLYVWRDLGSR